ncbi:MAG: hypothetical protein HY267_08800 [Deltaproteobacteria bacterium]|nr:hypothetical protein [Deltaproteobacteria bacterium]
MEKKWGPVCRISAQVLLLLLCLTPQAQAKVKIKNKAKVMVLHAGHVPVVRSSHQKGIRPEARGNENFIKRAAVARHSQPTVRRAAHPLTVSRKKGKTIIVSNTPTKVSRLTKFRHSAKAVAFSTRRHERRRVVASLHGNLATDDAESPTRQVLIENNYDPADVHTAYAPETTPFPIQVNNEQLVYRVDSVFALPGETLTLAVGRAEQKVGYSLRTTLPVIQLGPSTWSWKAPREAGVYPVAILPPNRGTSAQLNVFVMVPFPRLEHGYVNGYHIGNYPATPLRQLLSYSLPRGFIAVTEANQNTWVSPHFRLRQFTCKQESDFPKYIVLDPRLLTVLETVLKKVNERGQACPTLSIMSGYRTPFYNRAIGNVTTYSRHLWGDAADIFIDANPVDGEMDDLNRDGTVNIRDTELLYDIVHSLYESSIQRVLASGLFYAPILQRLVTNGFVEDPRVQPLMTGGLARYRENGAHGPFVHVDVRGVFTRWGQ